MDQLPQEIILRILSRLPVTSLMRSMLVCRAWRRLIQDPDLASKHFSHMADRDPSFIFQSAQAVSYQLYYVGFSDHTEGKVIIKKLPDSSYNTSMHLVDSCNGLLCMRDWRHIHYICNPFTELYLELQQLVSYSKETGHINLGFHQATNEYKVVHIVLRRQSRRSYMPNLVESEVHILTLGDTAWRNLGSIPYDLIRPMSKAMVNGRLHWLSKPNYDTMASLLVSFDLATEQFQEVPKPDCCGLDRCLHLVMVLRGCLSAVAYHQKEQMEIWVMKDYGVKESWIKEFTIGTYLPQTLQQIGFFPYKNASDRFPNSYVRVLCILKTGEILLEYRNKAIVLYNPQQDTYKEVTFREMSHWLKIVEQVGCLNWIDTPIKYFEGSC